MRAGDDTGRPRRGVTSSATLACGVVALLLVSSACGCEPRVSLGARCERDLECGTLRCLFGRCRAECVTSGECGGALECNDGVCAEADESCSETRGCDSPQLACAGSICTPRCAAGACPGDAVCVSRVGVEVCVPADRGDAGPELGDAGLDAAGQLDASEDAGAGPPGPRAHPLCLGRAHACAVRPSDGRVYCWGWNQAGVLGDADSPSAPRTFTPPGRCGLDDCSPRPARPVQRVRMGRVEPLTGIRSLACGDGFMCASDDVSTYCWGGPGDGYQLGYGGLGYVAAISAIEGTHVVAGDHHACVLGPSGPLCWGENGTAPAIDGRLGQTGPSTSTATRATRFDGAVDLSARSGVTCMRHATGVECAGSSLRWITGSRLTGPDPEGGVIPGLVGTPTDLGVQSLHACAIVGGTISCWGWNTGDSLGRGDGAVFSDCEGYSCDEVARPVTIRADPELTGLRFVALSRGDAPTTCAIEQARGRVLCWGENALGQAGVDPTIRERVSSIEAFVRREDGSVLEGAVDVACGAAFCCAIQADGAVDCWGENDLGQLGNDTVDSESIDAGAPFDAGTASAFAHAAAVRVDFSATE